MKILLVGAGGYAVNYIKILLNTDSPLHCWEGLVDPYICASPYKEQIEFADIPVYPTMEAFYDRHNADLAIICTPTYLHCEQSVYALSKGSDVLCEKPAASTVEEVTKMLEAERKYGRFLAIGYQWSYSNAIQNLKADILNGVFGKPIFLKTVISWPRSKAYYQRGGGWGGRIKKDGRLILDSIASNACAHYLHNMFFVLGDTMLTSASVADFQAECYRANNIENFDTCSIRMHTAQGAELYFAATHAAHKVRNPEFIYTFEKGTVVFSQDEGSQIVANMNDGRKIMYGNPFENSFKKLWDCVEAVKSGTAPICTVNTALPHVRLIEDIYRTTPIHNFDIGVNRDTDTVSVSGLYQYLNDAYERSILFSETGADIFTEVR